jgi:hypothetical protein
MAQRLSSPGWYADPVGEHEKRYWDGVGWTGWTRDASVHTRIASVCGKLAAVFGVFSFGSLGSYANGGTENTTSSDWAWAIGITFGVFVVSGMVAIFEAARGKLARRALDKRMSTDVPPAGWYRDPEQPTRARRWDGERWDAPTS